ncbi:MAG: TGS domain-containing protein [archaeon]
MVEEITTKEITQGLNYAKERGAKQSSVELTKNIVKDLLGKKLPKEAILGIMLKEIPQEQINEKEIEETFGKETLEMIKTIKQIDGILDKNYQKIPAETLSSIILSLAKDFAPIIVKIVEISNALYYNEKIIYEGKYAQKAEEIWYPLATKLGLTDYAWKIQDFGFRVTNPAAFTKIKKIINKTREEREKIVNEMVEETKEILKGKINSQVGGRPKSFKSIHDKIKKVPIKQMYDIYGIRIICDKEKECYEALGYIHSKYNIIPEAFDDYISKPKPDGYKSIHTAVKRGKEIAEFQIRTWEHHMRTMAEPYWQYKKLSKDKEFEKELSWESQLIEWRKSGGKEVGLGKKLSGNKIFAFTPKNEVIMLPQGATTIDFAFAVHTDIGKRMQKAKVNGQIVPIETKLNNLDKVEIITAEKEQMKKPWFNFVLTDKAKAKIKAAFGMYSVKKSTIKSSTNYKKIKIAECCNPLPGEDVIGVKTTKRRIIIHKKNCPNLSKMSKEKLFEIGFDKARGKTQIRITVIDRPGIMGEMLFPVRTSGATLVTTNFKIKKSGFGEAIFGLEVGNLTKLEKIINEIEKIPGVQNVERI